MFRYQNSLMGLLKGRKKKEVVMKGEEETEMLEGMMGEMKVAN